MNIAIFTDTYFPDINGVAASVHTLSQELRKRGHKVYVFTVTESRSVKKKAPEDQFVYRFTSVPIIFLKPYRAASLFSFRSMRLIRLIKKFKIDLIHTQSEFFMGFMALYAATSFRIPIVHTYHTMWADYIHYIGNGKIATPQMAHTYSKFFSNLASTVIAPTDKTKQYLLDCGVTKPIYVIPTGIDLDPFRKNGYADKDILAIKKKHGIDPSWPIILCLGRVAKEKSLDQAIRQMPEILRRIPRARMVIVGKGPALDSLAALAEEIGVKKHVIFIGAVPYQEIGKYYRLGDLFLCCSTTETQGLTYYEAMAAELPIIARNDDCIRRIIRDKIDGRLFDDPVQIPELVESVLTNRSLASGYVKNAYEGVKSYSAESFGARVEDVYMHTLDRKIIRHEQRMESVVKNPMPRAFRQLRLVTAGKISNARYNKKNPYTDRRK